MKLKRSLIPRIALISVMAGGVYADPVPQPDVLFTQGSGDTWNADWMGNYGRTYFSLGSTDLESWEYLPIIEFSDGGKGVGGEVNGTPKYFFRLHYTDAPTTNPELEDFADDGIGSMVKVLMGMNPFTPLAWLDVDADGIHDTIEQFWFGNLTGTSGGTRTATASATFLRFRWEKTRQPTKQEIRRPVPTFSMTAWGGSSWPTSLPTRLTSKET
jgi:hypothetical protein